MTHNYLGYLKSYPELPTILIDSSPCTIWAHLADESSWFVENVKRWRTS